ncbi:hypothetical protein [Wenjunlia tyrosinilytica]|uniref:Uncharacterized protein n=1 Tax=Wenjunlia tyrosinilytica TaxID=1544741 RepID=A0A918DSW2_9ACTN|nr:hypothetical protein [Wenjunlia tyrosinilytica]GGO82091.1 hypothetical protein GCM10012280_07850 [Wenjunlia tyrosinilytica]
MSGLASGGFHLTETQLAVTAIVVSVLAGGISIWQSLLARRQARTAEHDVRVAVATYRRDQLLRIVDLVADLVVLDQDGKQGTQDWKRVQSRLTADMAGWQGELPRCRAVASASAVLAQADIERAHREAVLSAESYRVGE